MNFSLDNLIVNNNSKMENNLLSNNLTSFLLTPSYQLNDAFSLNLTNQLQNDQPSILSNNISSSNWFEIITSYYSNTIHGWLSLIVCIFGIIANLVNILVLTRKEMRSPTNTILTGLAIADFIVMVDYVPYNVHNNIQNLSEKERLTFGWAIIALLHMHVSIVFHTISCWLTILLAVWRYLSVSFPTQTKTWLTLSKSVICIIVVYIIVPIYCIPCYMSFTIFEEDIKNNKNITIFKTFRIEWSEMASNDGFLKHLNIWVFGVGSKLVPCVLLTYLSFSLINVLIEADKRKRRLQAGNQRKPQNKINNSKPTTTTSGQTMLSNSLNSSNNVPLEVKHSSFNMNQVSNSSSPNQEKCLKIDKTKSQLSVSSAADNQENDSNKKNSDSNQIELEINSDCNNNCENNNQTLSNKENNNNKKRNSTCNMTKQFNLVIKSRNKDSNKNKIDKLTNTPLASTAQTPVQSTNVYLTTTQSSQQNDRTTKITKMLLSVLLIFLLTEFPSGILILLSSIMGETFFIEVYLPLGNVLDLLALLNSSVNFILYCTMSKQFRRNFGQLILRRKLDELSGVSKLKSNRKKHKKKDSFTKKKDKKKIDNKKKQNPSENEDKSTSVFVTSKC